MKKALAVLAGGALIVLLAACDLSSFMKPKGNQQTQQQQPSENPPPDTAPPPATTEPPAQTTPPPATQPTQPKQQPATQPTQPSSQPPSSSNQPPANQGNYPPPSNQGNYPPPSNQGNYPPPANQGGYNPPAGSNTPPGQSQYPQGKVRKGGLGVIFTGNLPQGQFRVKVDQELVYELAFSGSETRATKELLIEPGQHLVRFAVIDSNGVRGLKEETFYVKPGQHQTVRVSVKDTPGAIIVEHLE